MRGSVELLTGAGGSKPALPALAECTPSFLSVILTASFNPSIQSVDSSPRLVFARLKSF